MAEPDRHSTPLYTEQESQNTDRVNNNPRFSNCVRRLLLLIIMWILILGSIIVIAWLVINPHNPDFKLETFSVSNINLTDSRFNATYNVEFAVNNTNKKVGLLIDHVKISVLFKEEMVSDKNFEDCVSVKKMSQGKWQAKLGDDSVHKIKKGVFKDLSDAWSKKIVDFQVKMGLRIRFEYGPWPTKVRFMNVLCKNLTVEFRSTKGTGKLISGGNCLVH